jgi:hypothetical protein
MLVDTSGMGFNFYTLVRKGGRDGAFGRVMNVKVEISEVKLSFI